MRIRTLAIVLLLTGAALSSAASRAEMTLSKSIVEVGDGGSNRDDVVVFNSGDETLYVSVTPMQVLDPGTDEEVREAITDPEAAGLLVTPNRLIVPPGGRKAVRMVVLEPGDEEQIFRINFTPIAPPLELEEGQGAAIQVIVAYQVLLMSRPADASQVVEASRENQQLSLINRGNSNVLLTDGIQCPTEAQLETREGCATLPSKRLYAGNLWVTDLPLDGADSAIEFTVSGVDGNSKQRF